MLIMTQRCLRISKTPSMNVINYLHYVYSNIRRQEIVFDTVFDALNGSLQETSRLKSCPDLEHGEIATANHRDSSTMRAQLSQDGKSTSKKIQVGVQAPPNSLQKENTQDYIDKIAFESNMVSPYHTQNFIQNIPDF